LDEFKFLAQIHGVEVNWNDRPVKQRKEPQAKTREVNDLKFLSPGDYNHLSEEEKEELTRKMMGRWKMWAQTSTISRAGGK